MNDIEKTISLLKEISDYFYECRGNESFGSKAEEHFWELQMAAKDAIELINYQHEHIEAFMKDQEKIVLCKDCIYFNEDSGICVIGIMHGYRDTWFCAYGKRR